MTSSQEQERWERNDQELKRLSLAIDAINQKTDEKFAAINQKTDEKFATLMEGQARLFSLLESKFEESSRRQPVIHTLDHEEWLKQYNELTEAIVNHLKEDTENKKENAKSIFQECPELVPCSEENIFCEDSGVNEEIEDKTNMKCKEEVRRLCEEDLTVHEEKFQEEDPNVVKKDKSLQILKKKKHKSNVKNKKKERRNLEKNKVKRKEVTLRRHSKERRVKRKKAQEGRSKKGEKILDNHDSGSRGDPVRRRRKKTQPAEEDVEWKVRKKLGFMEKKEGSRKERKRSDTRDTGIKVAGKWGDNTGKSVGGGVSFCEGAIIFLVLGFKEREEIGGERRRGTKEAAEKNGEFIGNGKSTDDAGNGGFTGKIWRLVGLWRNWGRKDYCFWNSEMVGEKWVMQVVKLLTEKVKENLGFAAADVMNEIINVNDF